MIFFLGNRKSRWWGSDSRLCPPKTRGLFATQNGKRANIFDGRFIPLITIRVTDLHTSTKAFQFSAGLSHSFYLAARATKRAGGGTRSSIDKVLTAIASYGTACACRCIEYPQSFCTLPRLTHHKNCLTEGARSKSWRRMSVLVSGWESGDGWEPVSTPRLALLR